MALRGGALTIRYGTEVVGAIAVSGSAGKDEACARAGLATLETSFGRFGVVSEF